MHIGTFETYKGFKGSIEYEDGGRMFGSIYGIGEDITYEAIGDNRSITLLNLYEEYKKAIDNYIQKLIDIEMAKPKLKIEINWSLHTDGDYSLDNLQEYIEDIVESGCYSGYRVFIMSEDKGCRREAITFLEKLLCDIRFSYTHYYIMSDMYKMFETSINFISNRDNYGSHYEYISGNYDGTEICIKISRAE